MMTKREINHCLFCSDAIYFVARRPLTKGHYDELCRILASKTPNAHPADIHKPAAIDRHWFGLEERMAGQARWDKICPLSEEWSLGSLFTLNSILDRRPYISFPIEGVRYLIEVFNPKGELDVPYKGAGEAVVALLFVLYSGEYSELAKNVSFNEIIRDFDAVLECERICGTDSLHSIFSAYIDGTIPLSERPWDRLFDLDVRRLPESVDHSQLSQHFQQVEVWPDGRVQLQVKGGISSALGKEYSQAARAVGTTHYKDLHPDN